MLLNHLKINEIGERPSSLVDGDYRLRLSSKRLRSGKCQVKFYATLSRGKDLYGYVLVDAEETLKEVVGKIKDRLNQVKFRDTVHHINLYAIGQHTQQPSNFIVFDA